MSGGKWRSVSVYSPLCKEIQKLIDEEKILFSNINQFVNAVVERAYNEAIERLNNSNQV